ncbi:MAG: C45 family autoproteolytic acyltransferase/hydrolase [Bacteroidales bacterium]
MALKFQQQVIHQVDGDSTSVIHLKLSGSLEEIGSKLGEIARDRHGITKAPNPSALKNACQVQYMRKNYPVHFRRMKGLAQAYNEDLETTRCDFTCFGAPVGEASCSAVFYPPDTTVLHQGILSRNADLPTDSRFTESRGLGSLDVKAPSRLYVIEMVPDQGFASLVNLSFELYGLGLDGINSEGLVVTHLHADVVNTHLYKPSKEYGVGINEMLVVQMLLDNCSTVEEAKELLLSNKHFYMLLPTHLLVADRQGGSFVWEHSPQHNQEYVINRYSEVQILTNHPVHAYPHPDAFPAAGEQSGSFERFRTLKNAVEETRTFTLESIKRINSLVFIRDEMYDHPPQRPVRTIYHNLYNTHQKTMEISFYRKDEGGQQLRTEYFMFGLG